MSSGVDYKFATVARVSKWVTVRWPQIQYSTCQIPKITNNLIEKGRQRENSATLPLPDISSSQGALAALQLDDTISTSSIPIPTKYKLNIGLFELLTNEAEKTIDVVAVHGLQGNAYMT